MSDLHARLLAAIDGAERRAAITPCGRTPFILRACVAHRRVVERHAPTHSGDGEVWCGHCAMNDPPVYPCPDVRDIAGLYGVEDRL